MRPAGAYSPTAPDKPKGESMDERDQRMEQMLDYDREGEPSTMAYVSAYQEKLVKEFLYWREEQFQARRTAGESTMASLPRWEVIRFGGELFRGAHGILAFWVRVAIPEGQGGRVFSPGYFDHGPNQSKRLPAKPDAMVSGLARDMAMPHSPGRKAHERRIAELEAQRDGLRLDTDGAR